jgi:hypothetical protein
MDNTPSIKYSDITRTYKNKVTTASLFMARSTTKKKKKKITFNQLNITIKTLIS